MKDIATKIRVFLEGVIIWCGGVSFWAALTLVFQSLLDGNKIVDSSMIMVILAILIGALVIWVLYSHRKELDNRISTWLFILLNAIPFALVAQFIWIFCHSFD
ncbi:MAG: hypothetical protein J5379_05090 [Clostridiales bacterium]|nr:hypothetical protein [Clostridiales bacterium]